MKRYIFILLISLIFVACNNSPTQKPENDREQLRESLLGANTMLIDAEDQEILDFIERHNWDMEATGSGLRYQVYEKGSGPYAQKDMIAHIHYTISLITGDQIYSSADDGVKQFRIGRGGVESGLEEGILLLRAGDKAHFILPSHLAHGVPGDGVKVPKRATIIYDVHLIDLE